MPNMPEKTVNFDNENSLEDFGIVFESLTIGSAEPQLVLIDVPFRNGTLDETDYFGDVRYKDRTITMGFLIPWWSEDQYGIFANVQNSLNGQRKKITLSADQDWYYEGRLSVGDFKIEDGFWKFEITATVEPYKYSDESYTYSMVKDVPLKIVLHSDYMKTVPSFTTNVPIRVQYKDNTYSFSAGTHKNAGIVFDKGYNYLTVTALEDSGEIVSENLIPPPYIDFETYGNVIERGGITFTFNEEDGNIRATGSNISSSVSLINLYNGPIIDNPQAFTHMSLSGAPYISGKKDCGVCIYYENQEGREFFVPSYSDEESPLVFEVTSDMAFIFDPQIAVMSGVTLPEGGVIFTPSLIGYKSGSAELTIKYRQGSL